MYRAHAFRSVLLIVSLLVTIPTFAQEPGNLPQGLDPHEMTDMPISGRYQVIQSQVKRAEIFRLDRFTGDTFLLFASSLGGSEWRRIPKAPGLVTTIKATFPRFFLFLSGWGVADTFLIDTLSGITWEMVTGSNGALKWQVIIDPLVLEGSEDRG